MGASLLMMRKYVCLLKDALFRQNDTNSFAVTTTTGTYYYYYWHLLYFRYESVTTGGWNTAVLLECSVYESLERCTASSSENNSSCSAC